MHDFDFEDADSVAASLAAVNARFNAELARQIAGTLPPNHIYQLGYPNVILKKTGIPDWPIELSASRLLDKSKQRNHEFEIADMYGLPAAIQNPIAIFIYGNQAKAQNIIIATERDSKKFVVGLHLNQWRKDVIVNSIRGLFNKNTAEWLNWVAQGKLLYADKEKIQTLIDKQRTNLADVAYLDLDLVTKILKAEHNGNTET